MKKLWVIPVAAALVLLADIASKQWALATLHAGSIDPFIPGLLNVTLTTNTGAAFGIGHEFKLGMTLLPIGICSAIIYWIAKRSRGGYNFSLWEQLGYGLVLGGALGNIAERLSKGHVTDFLDFAFMNFPIFNVADALIDVGVGIIILHSLFAQPDQIEPKTAPQADSDSTPKTTSDAPNNE